MTTDDIVLDRIGQRLDRIASELEQLAAEVAAIRSALERPRVEEVVAR